jgi:rhodanese-related sulfurtransferase
MPTSVGRDEVRRLADEAGAQVVEVLPQAEYAAEHLPGALNLPLAEVDGTALGRLDPARPVVVYCYDYQ